MKKYYAALMLACMLGFSHVGAEELISAESYASYYGEAFNGKPTSSGEIFDMNLYTAAHKTLPFGTLLEVTNLENGKKVVVRVNDRGPFVANRELDLSKAAAQSLGMLNRGIARVSIKKLDSPNSDAQMAAKNRNNNIQENWNTEPANTTENTNTSPYAAQSNTKPFNNAERQQYVKSQFNQPSATEPEASAIENNETRQNNSPAYSSPMEKDHEPQERDYRASRPAYQPEPAYNPVKTEESAGVLWRIQLGAFTREENALRLVVGLRKIGLEPAYERAATAIRVVLPGIRPADLEYVKQTLKEGAFTDYIIRQERW